MVDGSYSELIHLFALSRALATTIIQSYCPSPASSLMHPYTAYTNQSSFSRFLTAGFVTVMWNAASPTDTEPINVVLPVPCQQSSVLRCDVQQWMQTTRYRRSVMIISNGWRMPSSAEPVEGLSRLQETNSQWEGIPISNGPRKK